MFERVNRLTIDDMISIMENHNVTGKPVKLLSMGYSEHEILKIVLDTLKAYRDTGMSPEEIKRLLNSRVVTIAEDQVIVDRDAFNACITANERMQDELEKLTVYKNSGLSPEQVQKLAQAKAEKESAEYVVEATGSEAKHIINLLRAKAEGRLVVLPCKVGNTVYCLNRNKIEAGNVLYIAVYETFIDVVAVFYDVEPWGENENTTAIRHFNINTIGKTVFLSREEAEKAIGVKA